MNTLFNQDDHLDETKNYYEELVGEGKKFKDNEALARGKYEADRFIEAKNRQYDALHEEYTRLRNELTAGANLSDVLDQLKELQNSSRKEPESNEHPQPVKPEELESLFTNFYQKNKQTEIEQENFRAVQSKIKERFGSNAAAILKEKSETLGLTEAEVENLARKNPALFYKTFDVEMKNEQFQSPPTSNKRSEGFAPKAPGRTKSYYDELRKKNPREFLSPQVSIQMHKDALALGEAFFDT